MEQRNLIIAIIISAIILLGSQVLLDQMQPPAPAEPLLTEQAQTGQPTAPTTGGVDVPTAPGTGGEMRVIDDGVTAQKTREAAVAEVPRIRIDSGAVHGSISLVGARIDDVTVARYRETLDPTSPEVTVLSPVGAASPYYAQFGWIADGGQSVALPDADTIWTADKTELRADDAVTLSWDNGEGLTFRRTYALDQNYMFTITQSVENRTGEVVRLFPYGLLSRTDTPAIMGFFILHEGPLGVFDGTLAEIDYDDLRKEGRITKKSTGGWAGITDKYWLTALVPDQTAATTTRFSHRRTDEGDKYQVDYVGGGIEIAPGGVGRTVGHFFAGAKEVKLLDYYADEIGIDRFDLAIDFGWFYFLTKPIFYMLLFFNSYIGNLGLSILALTVALKLVMFPLANKSYTAMSKMKLLQPKIKKLQERFGEDKTRLNQEMMALYKREKVNPASGCLPILVQIPVFFALYKVLFVNIELRHAPFFGWVQDLSAPDPTNIFTLFGLLDWGPPTFLMIGIWPIIMGASMYLQQKLNPQPTDPIQAKIMMALPIVFTFLLAQFPAGLVIYWAWNNILSITQQWYIMRRMGSA